MNSRDAKFATGIAGAFVIIGGVVWFVATATGQGFFSEIGKGLFASLHSSPEELEFQRQRTRQREAERERQAEFERSQTELEAEHRRHMQQLEAERRLKETEDRIREAEHRRKMEEQTQIVKAPPTANKPAGANIPNQSPNAGPTAKADGAISNLPENICFWIVQGKPKPVHVYLYQGEIVKTTDGGEVENSYRIGERLLQATDKMCVPTWQVNKSHTVEIGNDVVADAYRGRELKRAVSTGESDPQHPLCLMDQLECASRGFAVRDPKSEENRLCLPGYDWYPGDICR